MIAFLHLCEYGILLLVAAVLLGRGYLKCTIKRCDSKASLKGKVVIVTGANTGIGYHTAKDLAARGGRVIIACRNEMRGLFARNRIVAETGNREVHFKHLDLSSLDSVRKFAEEINNIDQLDVLVNNAGVYGLGDRYTADGIVEGMQINYFGPFLLTLLLLDLLKKSRGRIVNVTSLCHFRGEINLDNINQAGQYNSMRTYANSKLSNLIFAVELARRLSGTGVVVNAVHPGVTLTNITSNETFSIRFLFKIWCWICWRTPEEGAQTLVYLSVAEECANRSGRYFVDCEERFMSWKADNTMLAKNLWYYSEKLVRCSFK